MRDNICGLTIVLNIEGLSKWKFSKQTPSFDALALSHVDLGVSTAFIPKVLHQNNHGVPLERHSSSYNEH